MLPSQNNQADFLGLNFSNIKGLLRSVSIKNLQMNSTSYGYWVISTPGKDIPLRAPYALALTSTTGQRLAVSLHSLQAQDLGLNFS